MAFLPTITLFLMNTCPLQESILPCNCRSSFGLEVTCDRLISQTNLVSLFKPLKGYSLSQLTLSNTNLSTLPTDAFQGLHVKDLTLEKVEVEDASFRRGKKHFQGLEDSLEKLQVSKSFRNGHRPLLNLKLDTFKNLRVALFEDNHIPEVGNDWFTSGPVSLTQLIFENNGIEEVGEQAFESLIFLELLAVARNHLRDLSRSMFPTPALRLHTLDLEGNSLRNIPSNLFADMPSLKSLNLNNNLIHVLPEETYSFLSVNSQLSVKGNPVECSENLRWICQTGADIDGTCINSGITLKIFCYNDINYV